jgi:hypothetical protein
MREKKRAGNPLLRKIIPVHVRKIIPVHEIFLPLRFASLA